MSTKLLIFSDDWGRHPSSSQHLIRQLMPTMQVTWVNTIGMRPPRLDLMTLRRGSEKVVEWMRGSPRKVVDRSTINTAAPIHPEQGIAIAERSTRVAEPNVIDAKMWPWMSRRWDRWLNQTLLSKQLFDAAQDSIAITTIPIVADLVNRLPAKQWVYYCVDDFSVWPGLDGKTLGRMEDELIAKVDKIIAVSDKLAEGIGARGYDCDVLTHGVDLEFWKDAKTAVASEMRCEPIDQVQHTTPHSPLALFWGVVDRRMNADWLLALANQLTDGKILLVGPQQDPDPRLAIHHRISMPGPVPMEELPLLAQMASVLIMPYADLPVTRAMQPLKLKEYLATRRPIVCSRMPATMSWADHLYLANDTESFVNLTLELLGQLPSKTIAGYTIIPADLSGESWSAKAAAFRNLIRG